MAQNAHCSVGVTGVTGACRCGKSNKLSFHSPFVFSFSTLRTFAAGVIISDFHLFVADDACLSQIRGSLHAWRSLGGRQANTGVKPRCRSLAWHRDLPARFGSRRNPAAHHLSETPQPASQTTGNRQSLGPKPQMKRQDGGLAWQIAHREIAPSSRTLVPSTTPQVVNSALRGPEMPPLAALRNTQCPKPLQVAVDNPIRGPTRLQGRS
ncbi:hypothetical protein B0T20DRAFT_396893 [Sordaria brevicollis]|uniref:Uncharacterized protein n=1 Tax=Sordaria brevicollis TaxID=83679 RepID=A0AAE0P1Q5_SORBR|nr:hypothetical protein B0T20DRAFT_396893 [Sordaria brevicollis]